MRFRALLGLLCCACVHATRAPREPTADEPVLRVLTYNVNFGIAGDEDTLAAIESSQADVVFLQEANAQWQAAAANRLRAKWPHQWWLDDRAAGGQAVLSRWEFSGPEVIDAPTGWFPGVRVVAKTPLGPLQVLSVHLHPPVSESGSWVKGYFNTTGLRKLELEEFAEHLAARYPTLVVGDFNEGTSGEAVGFLEKNGLRSALPEFAPKAKTWRWQEGPVRLSAQFDHLAYDARLEPLSAEVLPLGNSDHLPVRAVFTRSHGAPRPPAPSGKSLSFSFSD